jgi:hypothetical protein
MEHGARGAEEDYIDLELRQEVQASTLPLENLEISE